MSSRRRRWKGCPSRPVGRTWREVCTGCSSGGGEEGRRGGGEEGRREEERAEEVRREGRGRGKGNMMSRGEREGGQYEHGK